MKKYKIPILSTILGFVVGLLYFQATDIGFFVKWKSLGIPPERPVAISAVTLTKVYIATENNGNYSCSKDNSGNCWSEEELPSDETFLNQGSCRDSEIVWRFINRPDGEVVTCKHAMHHIPEAYIEDYLIIENDGEIWMWEFFSPSVYQSYLRNFPLFTCMGISGGLIIGLVFLKLRSRKPSSVVEEG